MNAIAPPRPFGMRPVGKRVTFRRRLLREFLDIVDLESEMGQVGTDHDRAAFVELADLNFFLAARAP